MTKRYCDACGKEIADPEIGEHLYISEAYNYDVCDICGRALFAILTHRLWAGAKADQGRPEPPFPGDT